MSQSLFEAHKLLDKVQIFSQKIMTLTEVPGQWLLEHLEAGFFYHKNCIGSSSDLHHGGG